MIKKLIIIFSLFSPLAGAVVCDVESNKEVIGTAQVTNLTNGYKFDINGEQGQSPVLRATN
ncbi:hypothetical protein VC636_10040 [Citrobacter freundii]|uniref:hypothetical protein n=1 Tax=Citrobacter freundii TaxID=546 RepID=UPI00292AEBCA|nr:hypothetical protein [Citrobacter freundii]MDV0675309.1 hypothetical protein [Citrobacter freundii]MDV0860596.1 hypothetical protein [Citrobacter freundii]MEB0574841.1 hypothetical protein [Citrobacter freundii]MEB0714084.1 hypothetical protein [Citrobacter freundii]